jgi:hypothetical protein
MDSPRGITPGLDPPQRYQRESPNRTIPWSVNGFTSMTVDGLTPLCSTTPQIQFSSMRSMVADTPAQYMTYDPAVVSTHLLL